MERKYLNEGTLMCFIWRHKKHKNVFLGMTKADYYDPTYNFIEALFNEFRWQEFFTESYIDEFCAVRTVNIRPYGALKLADFERVRVCVEE